MSFFLKALVALFTMIDPVGLVPVVLGLTVGMPARSRVLVITRATIIAAVVIAVFGIFGQIIFASLGVTGEAFSIAGGVLLFLVAIDMLFGRQSGARETPLETQEALAKEDMGVAVFPLAIPMIAGPGTITTIILLVQTAGTDTTELMLLAVAAAITLVAAWLAMLISLPIQKRIGTTGILVLSRVLGMLLAAVAAQFILNGIALFISHSVR
ncbi:MAG: MarC family protein [Ktedonobacterales bacterium]|nr:MarC family protein [Ktedonobacterales bacterium]